MQQEKFTLNQRVMYTGNNPGQYEIHVPPQGTKGKITEIGQGNTYDFLPDDPSKGTYIVYGTELKAI